MKSSMRAVRSYEGPAYASSLLAEGRLSAVPNEYECELRVYGPAAALARFREDRTWWQLQPWASCYPQPMVKTGPKPGSLVFRYDTDVKRPGPPVAEMAAAYPELTLVERVVSAEGDGLVKAATYVKGGSVADPRDQELPGGKRRRALR